MEPLKVNLLSEDKAGELRPTRRFYPWKWGLLVVGVLVITVPVALSVVSVRLLKAASSLDPLKSAAEKPSLFEQVGRLVNSSERALKGTDRDRVNLLVLGEGGEGHEGAHLTDTMLFVSIRPSDKQVGILSIPRDLWIRSADGGLTRINNINAFAENKQAGSGGEAARLAVAQVLDQPIDYYVRLDFAAFKTLIDDVGGVTVNVTQSFVDEAYPTDNNLYQTIRFAAGWQTMNGDRALMYVRSRHGSNGEGSDFARSRRQQEVIAALKDKLLSFDTLLNPSRLASVLETLQAHVVTNLELWEVAKLAQLAKDVDQGKIARRLLSDDENSPLYATTVATPEGGAYALLPRRGDWTDVQRIARDLLDPTRQPTIARQVQADTGLAPDAEIKPLKIEVLNGTWQTGLAKRTGDLLTKTGYQVTRIGNAEVRGVRRTVIYDQTGGAEPAALASLKSLLNAEVAPAPASGNGPADFAVVLGQNAI